MFFRGMVGFLVSIATIGAAAAQELKPVNIGLSSGSIPAAAPKIAQQLGLFEKHGLAPKITTLDSGNVAAMALIANSIDFSSSGPPDVVVGSARGQALVAVANLYGGFSPALTIAKTLADKSGVSPSASTNDRYKAVDNFLIATPSATSFFTLGMKCAAEKAGAKVRFTYMAQPAMVAALESGAIQGFLASAPFYGVPVVRGYGTLWASGPKGEFAKECVGANSATLNASRAYAEANPDMVKRMRAVFADFATAVRERPNDVKAALSKLYPDVDAATLDLIFQSESVGFAAKPLTVEDMAREIAFVKESGAQVPGIEKVTPESLLVP